MIPEFRNHFWGFQESIHFFIISLRNFPSFTFSWQRSLSYRNQLIETIFHIETSSNQWTDFYMIGNFVMKEFKWVGNHKYQVIGLISNLKTYKAYKYIHSFVNLHAEGKRANLERGVTRTQSTPNFPRNEHFLSPDTHTYVSEKTKSTD